MGRAKRIFSDEYPYHVTARCINRDWFAIPLPMVWRIFADHLYFACLAYGAQIHAFVLMSNHFHLLITTPQANLDKIMWYVMTEVSRDITKLSGRINQTFGGPYFASLITNHHYYLHCYKYVYRNPVEAQIVKRVEEYPFSTLRSLIGMSTVPFPLLEDDTLFNDFEGTLSWMNETYATDVLGDIEKALRKGTFSLPVRRSTRSPNPLEVERS
jgi:REP element-mobilizing transposase RayT